MTDSIRVLHVDDDSTYSDLVATFLSRKDDRISVETATSAAEGLEQLSEADIDCIVSDYKMPGMDGLEFLEEVRKEYPDVPFILFTGKGSDTVAQEAISSDSVEYLEKRVDSDPYALLAHRIRDAVERQRVEESLVHTQSIQQVLLEEISEAILITGPDGELQYVSPVAEDMLGYLSDELDGTNWFDYVHPDDEAKARDLFDELRESPSKQLTYKFRLRRRDGGYLQVEGRCWNLLEHELIRGMVVFIREIPTARTDTAVAD